ncbi:hypothetical protein ACVWZV_004444 [Bradyrhizobium sp. GM5.1]
MSAGTPFTHGALRVIDTVDNDLDTDGRSFEERPEAMLVGDHAADFTGFYNFGGDNGAALFVPETKNDAGNLAVSAASLALALVPSLFTLAGAIGAAVLEAAGIHFTNFVKLGASDPYDPNYHTVYQPPTATLPVLPSGLPTDFQTDVQNLMQAVVDSASLAKASYVTQNRMLSAIQDGDQAGFDLQNAQLNQYVAALGAAETKAAQAITTFADDLVKVGVDVTLTPAQITDLQAQLSAGGFSALPQIEQDLLNQLLLDDPTQKDAVVKQLTSVDPTTVPTDLIAALNQIAAAHGSFGSTFSIPADPNALAGVHQPIFASAPISSSMTENGSDVAQGGTLSFVDANSSLTPTITGTAASVTATGTNLTLTDAQKAAFASAFGLDTHTGAWGFNLKGSDAAFLIPGDSVKIVETVTIDDGQGGTATQDETFTVLGSHATVAVERFFDTATGDHFHTFSPAEAAQVKATLPTYHDEGAPWSVPDAGRDTIDVFRFFDTVTGTHFLTSSTVERDFILAHTPALHFEGVAFESYTAPEAGTLTLERFFNSITGLHHLSASPAETASLHTATAIGAGWLDEGAGFIVHA